MLVRSSSYQSQYIFGKDFHLRRLQKVTTESFPPAGGNRKLIGHGICIYIYTLQTSKGQANCLTEWFCFTPHGNSEFTQVWIAWERPAGPYLNSGHSGHSCFISCWIRWASEMWNHIQAWDTCSVACSLVCLCSVCVSPLVLPFTGSSDISPLPTELLQPRGLVGRNPTEFFACDVNRLFVTLAKSVGRNLFLTLALCFSTCCFKRECTPVSVLYRKRITSYPPQTSLVAANREAWTGDWRLLVTCAWQWLHCTGAYRILSPCHDLLSSYSVLHPLAAISGLTFCGANKTRRKTEHLLDWDSLHRSGQEHGSLAPRNVLVGRLSVEVGAGQVVPDQLEQRKQWMFHTTVEISGRFRSTLFSL